MVMGKQEKVIKKAQEPEIMPKHFKQFKMRMEIHNQISYTVPTAFFT